MDATGLCGLREDDRLVTPEKEAAEALAGLARGCATRSFRWSSVPSDCLSQDQPIDIQKYCRNMSSMDTGAPVAKEAVRVPPSQLRGRVKSASKVRKNLSEAEKEAQRVRRVLANRESARKTICRRQAMRLELIKKVAYLSEENKNLKKEKEVAVKDYESLKGRNELLKLQIANKTNVEPRETHEEPKSSEMKQRSHATTTPTLMDKQSTLVPVFWPPVAPYPNVFQLQCVSHPHVTNSSQIRIQDSPSSHQGKEVSLGNTGQGNPLFVLPVPWLLPVLTLGNVHTSHSDSNCSSEKNLSAHQCSASSHSDVLFVKDNHHSSSNPSTSREASILSRAMPVVGFPGAEYTFPEDGIDHSTLCHMKCNLLVPETLSCVRLVQYPGPIRHAGPNVFSPELAPHSLVKKKKKKKKEKDKETLIFRQKKSAHVYSAVEARKKRKELMQMKNIKYRHFGMHSSGD